MSLQKPLLVWCFAKSNLRFYLNFQNFCLVLCLIFFYCNLLAILLSKCTISNCFFRNAFGVVSLSLIVLCIENMDYINIKFKYWQSIFWCILDRFYHHYKTATTNQSGNIFVTIYRSYRSFPMFLMMIKIELGVVFCKINWSCI